MSDSRITVLGGGMIGGSICLGLRGARPRTEVVCLDLPQRLGAIAAAGVADVVAAVDRGGELVARSALVIVATPVGEVPQVLARIAPHLAAGTIVTDVGSTKDWIARRAAEVLGGGVWFVGGHPIAGSERSGVAAADPLIFVDRPWVLCPRPDTPVEALLVVTELIQDLQAIPVTLEPEEHDRLLAAISHAPQLLSTALMTAAERSVAGHGLLELLAGSGLLDMTRLAASDFRVWQSILATNEAAVREAMVGIRQSIDEVLAALDSGRLAPLWERAARRRREIGGDGRPGAIELRDAIDGCDRRLLGALGERVRAVRAMGRLKREAGRPVRDEDRERQMLARRLEWGRALALPPALVEALFGEIVAHSRLVQEELQGPGEPGQRPKLGPAGHSW